MKFIPLLIIVLLAHSVFAQNSGVRGKITDKNHEPLAGAYISINGTRINTTTDANGNFTLPRLSPGEYTLTVEFIGHRTFTHRFVVTANAQPTLDIQLDQVVVSLGEVKVFGHINQ